MPPRLTTLVKSAFAVMLSAALLCLLAAYVTGLFGYGAVGLVLLLLTGLHFGPMVLIHPYYHKYASKYGIHASEVKRAKRRRLLREKRARLSAESRGAVSAALKLEDLRVEPDSGISRGTVIMSGDPEVNYVQIGSYGLERGTEEDTIEDGESMDLDISKCSYAKVIAGFMNLTVRIEVDDFVTDDRMFMNPADMREIEVAKDSRVVVEVYFGKATPSMLHEADQGRDDSLGRVIPPDSDEYAFLKKLIEEKHGNSPRLGSDHMEGKAMPEAGHRMSGEGIPSSIKSQPFLEADYAGPLTYGWASVIVAVLALLVGIAVLALSGEPVTFVIIILGGILLLAGVLLIKRGKL